MNRFSAARLARLALPALALLIASTVQAQYFWIEGDADGRRIQSGELNKPGEALAVQGARAFAADGKAIALAAASGGYQAAQSDGDLRFTASHADEKSLSIYHARFGRLETKAVSDLELVPTTPGGNTYRLFWKGSAVSASQVNVSTSEGWSRVLRPATDGSISFTPSFPALYVLEVSARVNGAVTVDGRKYEDVRHVATLSFRVDR
ncbi:hypothetical protein [Rhodocyclus tenuis]|uniref:hypothetical protein n=1 Tax=Rhodocyclus tenuis TaxID=1066 RepID=UPI001909058A|nr:hypothetical protein [Rhodocyclus tenuis]MBK1680953.1 hypothetical protein [Rhodocyclus tenuis]